MLSRKALYPVLALVSALVLLLGTACQPQTVIVEKEVTREVMVEVTKEVVQEVEVQVEVEVTREVEKEVIVEVPAEVEVTRIVEVTVEQNAPAPPALNAMMPVEFDSIKSSATGREYALTIALPMSYIYT